MINHVLFYLLCFFLFSPCTKPTTCKEIFVSDLSSIYRVNPLNGETKKIINAQIADLSFNKATHTLFTVNRESKGYFEINENSISQCTTGLASSNYLYTYKNYVLSDSWIIHHDAKNELMGQFGIYDTAKRKLIRAYKRYGTFDAITGYKTHAYVSMFGSEKNNSNVYEVNLDTFKVRPIFHTPQRRIPKVIHDQEGNTFGLYKHWDYGPANELIRIDLHTGNKKLIAKLSPYTYNAAILGELAIIVHFDEMNTHVKIKDCISIVNLKTGLQTKMNIPNIRPTNVIMYDEKTVAVIDENGYLLLINPYEKKIVKKYFVHEGLYFVTTNSENTKG